VKTLQPDSKRRSLFWPLQLAGWGVFGTGMFVAGVTHWPLAYAAVAKTSLTLFGFAASVALRAVYRQLTRRHVALPVIVAAAIPLSYGAAGLWMAAHNFVVDAYVAASRAGALVPALALARFPDFANTIYFFFVLLCWSALYFGIPAYRDLGLERERLLRAEARAHEARLAALRLQLQPHFLFNALNAVSTLVADGRPAEANRMLARLADFLRATLDRRDTAEVPLSEEIAFTRQYLEIEEVRFGERLRVEVDVDPETRTALVPAMILQPLVENAVRHAIVPRAAGGAIGIVAARENGILRIGVHDDGPGAPQRREGPGASGLGQGGREDTARHGLGLANTRQRLEELYGSRAELTLGESVRGGLAVSLRLPFRERAGEEPA
jgi:two-component system, LytTR family, sensor kinase